MLAVFELPILSLQDLEIQRTWGWGDHVLNVVRCFEKYGIWRRKLLEGCIVIFNPLQALLEYCHEGIPWYKKYTFISVHIFGWFAHCLPDVTSVPFTVYSSISVCYMAGYQGLKTGVSNMQPKDWSYLDTECHPPHNLIIYLVAYLFSCTFILVLG